MCPFIHSVLGAAHPSSVFLTLSWTPSEEFCALMGRLERYSPQQLLGVRGANYSVSEDMPDVFKVGEGDTH